MRPIDAERLKAVLEKNFGHTGGASVLEQLIDEQPTTQPQSTVGQLNDGARSTARSTDLIDRQAVIDLLKQMRKDRDMVPWEGKDVFARIRKLPTIQPEKAQLFSEDTTSDTISRQAAIDAIVQCTNCGDEDTLREYVLKHSLDNGWTGGILEALDAVKDLPPAQPEQLERCPIYDGVCGYPSDQCYDCPRHHGAQSEPKEGHWIKHETPDGGEQYECSLCGVLWEFTDGTPEDNEAYFCPKCGSYVGGGRK